MACFGGSRNKVNVDALHLDREDVGMRTLNAIIVLVAGFSFFVSDAVANGFHGATVTDRDLPSSYMKIGLFGYRPVISEVPLDSVAAKHGFQRGDIIVSINGKDIKKSSELNQFMSDELSVSIIRNKEKMSVTIIRYVPRVAKAKPIVTERQASLQRVESLNTSGASQSVVVSTPKDAVRAGGTPAYQTIPIIDDIFSRPIKPSQELIVFKNSKGDVAFSHSVHLRSLNKEQCMLCHRTENPTHESVQSRLDNHRSAHSFCKGCHQKIDNAPTSECQVCHRHYKE